MAPKLLVDRLTVLQQHQQQLPIVECVEPFAAKTTTTTTNESKMRREQQKDEDGGQIKRVSFGSFLAFCSQNFTKRNIESVSQLVSQLA